MQEDVAAYFGAGIRGVGRIPEQKPTDRGGASGFGRDELPIDVQGARGGSTALDFVLVEDGIVEGRRHHLEA